MGISNEQIQAAIDALQERGASVTKVTVRRELGDTGSYGTIQNYLTKWRESQPQSEEAPVVVASIPDAVQTMFAKAWSAAQAAALAEFVPQREAMTRESDRLKAAVDQVKAENDEAIHILELQMADITTQLTEAAVREQTALARVAELSDALGYVRGKAEAAEVEARKQAAQKDARIVELEARLKKPAAKGSPRTAK
jgi:hypothetical protein